METEQSRQFREYHAAVGADTYRVSSRSETTKKVWPLTKTDDIDRGATPEQMPFSRIKGLSDKGTEHLYYTPLSKTHHIILIDDTTPEKVRQMQADGIPVCYAQESSTGNVQALVKIPRLTEEPEPWLAAKDEHKTLEYRASVDLAQELNKRYGDPRLTNAIQPHRAPGTPNVKEKHKRPDGTYPTVRPILTSGAVWTAGTNRLQKIMDERKAEYEHTQKITKRVSNVQQDGNPVYNLHAQYVRRNILKSDNVDMSRLDAMVATMLRATGHSQDDVRVIIEAGTDRTGRKHDWTDYAERAAGYAFSQSGTEKIARTSGYHATWQKNEEILLSNLAKQNEPEQAQPTEPPRAQPPERKRGHGLTM